MDRVLGMLPVPALASSIGGCSWTQPAAMHVKTMTAITASGFIVSPMGEHIKAVLDSS
jgi:hypothetical protein